ncbi:hypothetical protein RHGRI_013692 [Rhododendron griersonianum]|uniref:Beta-glucosidase n=1 Tax=Rhododendron griersonianum TaxID=479676 RepID=A0AAV6K728_9ERIC|nr:hypothetical protein RHGRI_013692 [Rhododendron griersonianum]
MFVLTWEATWIHGNKCLFLLTCPLYKCNKRCDCNIEPLILFLVGLWSPWYLEIDYPDITKKNAGKRLLAFTKLESELVKGAIDFIGLYHYNTFSIKDQSSSLKMNHRDFNADMAVELIGVLLFIRT